MAIIKALHKEVFPVRFVSTFFNKLFRSVECHCLQFDLNRNYICVFTFRIEGRSSYVITFGIWRSTGRASLEADA